jgi:recombination protein RecT
VTSQTIGGAVATQEPAPVNMIREYKRRFEAVLPEHLDVDSFIGVASGALYRNPQLLAAAEASPGSFMNALLRCASLGHLPGSDEFYLTPRKNKGKLEVLGIEGYRGIIERMYRSGGVASVIVREVCENDGFEFIEGEMDRPRHEVDWFGNTRGDMIGVYAYAILLGGAVSRVVVLSRDDVMLAKAKSDAANSEYSPWNAKDGGRSMWWKTAARRLEPWVPTSPEFLRERLRAAAEASNLTRPSTESVAIPAGVDPTTGEIHDAELVEEPTTIPEPAKD